MGMGITLAIGVAVSKIQFSKLERSRDSETKEKLETFYSVCGRNISRLFVFLCLLAAIFMGRALLFSYSRGAWLGTVCGIAYLIWRAIQSQTPEVQNCWRDSCFSWLKIYWFPLSVILVSGLVLTFQHIQQTEWHAASRVFSAVKTEDFSWRNRVDAWEGALQIAAEHPWIGTGWNQPEPLYEHYYLPPKLTESAAIQMNDYLTLGATLGIPALFCFGMYLWLSLSQNSEAKIQKSESANTNWLKAACHAGAIVLLVGFWFDGGLFKLPTAATFWILLELGNVQIREICEQRENG